MNLVDLPTCKPSRDVTAKDAAMILGLGRSRFNRLLYGGAIKSRRVGRTYVIARDELERFRRDVLEKPQPAAAA